ncbi:hypothetical protein ALC60_04537 [Trachymyrmex zeteki]|uniref:Uncharacterized protein n=1 Tax=Mycetomoellerius zeteki TaxID=64791 RepID=A0A151X820_9HYME|nr:hypothetical protein ALC60_04537 [Trachymyrmex zeteki]
MKNNIDISASSVIDCYSVYQEAISTWTFKKEDNGRFFVGQVGDAYSWGINTHLRCYCLRIHVFGLAGHVTQAATRIFVRNRFLENHQAREGIETILHTAYRQNSALSDI